MIRPLRRAHRAAIPFLGVLVLGGMALALTSKSEMPPPEAVFASRTALPGGAISSPGPWQQLSMVDGVEVEFRTDVTAGRVEIHAESWVPRPDLLVYVSPAAPPAGQLDGLPRGSRLLGSFSGVGSADYDARLSGEAWLVLYSGGHREILAAAPLGSTPADKDTDMRAPR